MITLTELREYLCLDPKMEGRLTFLRKSIIASWNKETKIRWDRPVGGSTPLFTKLFQIDRLNAGQSIFIQHPLVTIDEIKMWGLDEDEADGTVLAAEDYRLLQDKDCPWAELQPKGQSDDFAINPFTWDYFVQVKFDAGYDCDDDAGGPNAVPNDLFDIKEALMIQADFHLKRNSDTKVIQTNQGFEGGSTNYKTGPFHETFKNAVNRYKFKLC